MKNFYLFLSFLLLAIANGYLFNYLNDHFFHIVTSPPAGLSANQVAFLAVSVAPFFETLFCQFLLHRVLTKVFNLNNDTVCVLIMSLVFSQLHWYNWLYVIMTFFGGLILNSFYVIALKRTRYYFVLTVLLHALYNLYGVMFVP